MLSSSLLRSAPRYGPHQQCSMNVILCFTYESVWTVYQTIQSNLKETTAANGRTAHAVEELEPQAVLLHLLFQINSSQGQKRRSFRKLEAQLLTCEILTLRRSESTNDSSEKDTTKLKTDVKHHFVLAAEPVEAVQLRRSSAIEKWKKKGERKMGRGG